MRLEELLLASVTSSFAGVLGATEEGASEGEACVRPACPPPSAGHAALSQECWREVLIPLVNTSVTLTAEFLLGRRDTCTPPPLTVQPNQGFSLNRGRSQDPRAPPPTVGTALSPFTFFSLNFDTVLFLPSRL